ncbi:unnamed protein product [Cylindrotheca closterium]|uniref:Uncharacterized protein n=1 Tax=Cylindrotheca closterium TaxID=2856 RepID=A0AAD2CQ97_9STRA|nr:unnamed protein product [Cylindrotheca closterium]
MTGQQLCQTNRVAQRGVVGIAHSSFLTTQLSEKPLGEDGVGDSRNAKEEEGQHVGGSPWIESRQIDDYGLILGDILTIILASQLMGLLDALNAPDFAQQGGWFQPIPSVPSTLGTLVERISTLSLVWLLSAFSEEESYTFDAIENEKSSIFVALTIAVNFVALRCILAVVLAATSGGSTFDGNIFDSKQLVLVLRDCYFVVLGLPTFRFIYTKYWPR